MEKKEENEEEMDMCQALQDMVMEGKIEGKAEGKRESVLELLGELGQIPEELADQILAESDLDILSKWIKLAGKVHTVEEFSNKMA